ncbi:rhamnogalacturonan acetylesterase [Flavisolibacter sp. BT320]|nr:rhamnogalacturonan acetylesterase [Flavisolibacter longurius]
MKIFFFLAAMFLAGEYNLQAQPKKGQAEIRTYRFDFGHGKMKPGFVKVLPGTVYSSQRGYGIDFGSAVTANTHTGNKALYDGYLTAAQPFYFSVKLPEGDYDVKVTLGDDAGTSDAAIRAENRRMMVNRLQTGKGKHKTASFTLHVRDSMIAGTDRRLRLKPREHAYLHWDNKLTLEFNGESPKINAIEITPSSPKVVTVFLAGNSTVVDGASEPWSAWGQMIPSFFQPGNVSIANYAESGETLSSFIAARRFEKILSLLKPGDYVFVEFGHNDQKQRGEGIGAFTSYKKALETFIADVKKRRGRPVLVTSVQRRRFDSAGRIEETLGDYPTAVRQTAQEQAVPLIDLNALSKTMYEALGPVASLNLFVHYPANTFPGQDKPLADNTHFRPYGAYEIAKLVVKGIRDNVPHLARLLFKDVPPVDPAKPGLYEAFYWPLSPGKEAAKPDGD